MFTDAWRRHWLHVYDTIYDIPGRTPIGISCDCCACASASLRVCHTTDCAATAQLGQFVQLSSRAWSGLSAFGARWLVSGTPPAEAETESEAGFGHMWVGLQRVSLSHSLWWSLCVCLCVFFGLTNWMAFFQLALEQLVYVLIGQKLL